MPRARSCQLVMGVTDAGAGQRVEHHAAPHPHPAHRDLPLLRPGAGRGRLPFHGPAGGHAPPRRARPPGRAVAARGRRTSAPPPAPTRSCGAWAARTRSSRTCRRSPSSGCGSVRRAAAPPRPGRRRWLSAGARRRRAVRRSLVARAGDPRPHRSAAIPGPRVPGRRSRVPGRRRGPIARPPSARPSRPATPRAGGGWPCPPATSSPGAIHLRSNIEAARPRGRHPALQHRSRALPARGLHALGRRRAHELLAARLRLRGGEHRHHRQGHARRPGGRDALVALERRDRAAAGQKPDRDALLPAGGGGRPVEQRVYGEGHYLRPHLHPDLPQPQRPHRGRHRAQLAVLGASTPCSRPT